MNDFESSVALTIIGALIGAVIAPACELYILRRFKKEDSQIKAGFVLLCSANGLWLLSFPFFGLVRQNGYMLTMLVILYVLSALFFIGAFRAFRLARKDNEFSSYSKAIRHLSLGNFFWVIAEFAEAPLSYLQLDEFPSLLIKYPFLLIAFCFFMLAAVSAGRVEVQTANNT